jgi:hypothetical protein
MSRIYQDAFEMVREVERDLWEMGINVPVQSMQDKKVDGDPELGMTKELRAYGFSVTNPLARLDDMVEYIFPKSTVLEYCKVELEDRTGGLPLNPGNSWKVRGQVWGEFIHNGTMAYTYSCRMCQQLPVIIKELREKPGTRQAIINIHSNFYESFDPSNPDLPHQDLHRIGGVARIPCSMYYQMLRREGKLDLVYTMRSCDLLTHAPVDWWLAVKLQEHIAKALEIPVGSFHYFTGSLHAYAREMKARGIF